MSKEVRGYKVFNQNWTCRGKQYSCPGKFEEDCSPVICGVGMHFCKEAVDCFNYYGFDCKNKVAEVLAYGDVIEKGDKCCTNKLKIVREIPWAELLEIVNAGKACSGLCNSGNYNSGWYNSGNYNSGDYNSGNYNSGWYNSGNYNSGRYNSGWYNSGDYNSGRYNSGWCNSGDYNSGDYNSGRYNSGWCNSGDYNSGRYNSGWCNSGDYNSGDYNNSDNNSGCFNTKKQTIVMFNKPSPWTFGDWRKSKAFSLLKQIPKKVLIWTSLDEMTDEEKAAHPEAEVTGGYLKTVDNTPKRQEWWERLSSEEKQEIVSLPNFDKEIFKEITGIDVEVKDE